MPRNKRKQIEERLGQPLRTYLTARFLNNAVQRDVARELGLDHATIRYYIKKWDLPYSPKVWRDKERKEAKIKSKPMPRTHKRKQLEERLGQSLRSYLTAKFLKKATQKEVASELRVDRATIRYYIKKWDLPYDLKAVRERERKKAKLRGGHLEVCICPICKHRFCEEAKESHKRGRCVMSCSSFEGLA